MIQEVAFRDNAEINSTNKVLFWLFVGYLFDCYFCFGLGLFFVSFLLG